MYYIKRQFLCLKKISLCEILLSDIERLIGPMKTFIYVFNVCYVKRLINKRCVK